MDIQRIKKHIIPIVCLSAVMIILIIRSFYSFCWSDESFYVATINRLYQGDRLFVDEWHPSQLSMVIILPFYYFFMLLRNGDTTGIVLTLRILKLCIYYIVGNVMYFKLQKYHTRTISVLCVIAFWVYSRENIEGVSYYSLNLCFFLMSQVLLYDIIKSTLVKEIINFKSQMFFAGIFMALAIMANPYLIIPCVGVLLVCLLMFRYTRKYWKYALYYILGGVFNTCSFDYIRI